MKIAIKMNRLAAANKLKSESAAASPADIAAQLDSVKSAKAAATLRERLQKAIKREFEANAKLLQRFDAKALKLYPDAAPATGSRRKDPAIEQTQDSKPAGRAFTPANKRIRRIIEDTFMKKCRMGVYVQSPQVNGTATEFNFRTSAHGGPQPSNVSGKLVVTGDKAVLRGTIKPYPELKETVRAALEVALKPFGITVVTTR